MGDDKIQTNDGTFRVTQNTGDLLEGLRRGDLSRISIYQGPDTGVHTGNDSPTLGRHGEPFGDNK